MSLSVARSDGVTVLTVTSDTSSACPPLCQLLGALCYSPRLCSVSRHLPPQRGGAQAVLGALWIITGVLHIGLGVILMSNWRVSVYVLRDTNCPVWLGVLFMLLGVGCVLSERFPRPVLILLSGLLNLIGVALSIAGIVLYAIDINYPGFYSFCRRDYYDYGWYRYHTTTTASPERGVLQERCMEARDLMMALTTTLRAILLILAVLDLCLGLSSAILSFKSLKRAMNGNKPLLQDAKEED